MNSVLVSIIIPIYNVEKYIRQAVDSVLKQTYKNLEIILVNDGSPDLCPEICDMYQKQDKRIKTIHKENEGPSEARNSGIKEANGEYILFLDADDFYADSNAIERLIERAIQTQADVINFSYAKYYEEKESVYPRKHLALCMPENCISKQEQLDFLTKQNIYIASAWNKMIRKNLLTDDMLFEKGIYSEDIEWCARLLIKAGSMDFINENFYCYRQRLESISHHIDDKKCQDLHDNIIKCFDLAKKIDEDYRKYLYRYIAFQYGTFFINQAKADNFQDKCIASLKHNKWILDYHAGNKKLVCLNIGCKIMGYKNTCRIIRWIYRTIRTNKRK